MADESQVNPLAPSKIYGRSDEEFAAAIKPNHHKKSSKCLVYVLTGIVIQSILMLLFAEAVLRVQTPRVMLSSVTVTDLRYSTTPVASVNAAVAAEISVENKNFGRFEFENCTVAFLYQDVEVGGGRIDGGVVGARGTERVNVAVELITNDQLVRENQNFSGDVGGSGVLELRSYAKLVGRIHVMKILNKRRSRLMNCTMSLDLTTKSIQDLRCVS